MGIAIVTQMAGDRYGIELDGARVAIQGFGNVGAFAAVEIARRGGRIVAVSDAGGARRAEAGLDLSAVSRRLEEEPEESPPSVDEAFGDAEAFDPDDLLTQEVDIVVPAAIGGVLTAEVVADLRCRLVVEGANGPTTAAGHAALVDRDIVVVPDILANAGGVTVSYVEWCGNHQRMPWDRDRVDTELAARLSMAFAAVAEHADAEGVDLRTAAYRLAISRVYRAQGLRGT